MKGGTVLVGVSEGLGNMITALPLLKVLAEDLGLTVDVYSTADYGAGLLLERCRYVRKVYHGPGIEEFRGEGVDYERPPRDGYDYVLGGPWPAPEIKDREGAVIAGWRGGDKCAAAEWDVRLDAARKIGWDGKPGSRPNVEDWYRFPFDVRPDRAFDVGIVSGCKPGDFWKRRRYPAMGQLVRLLKRQGLHVVTFGKAGDGADGLGAPHYFAEDLHKLAEGLASCRIVVGIDSGPMHLAASLGCRTVWIFTATSPTKAMPVGGQFIQVCQDIPCRPCFGTPAWEACENWICRDIPADRVLGAAMMQLQAQLVQEQARLA